MFVCMSLLGWFKGSGVRFVCLSSPDCGLVHVTLGIATCVFLSVFLVNHSYTLCEVCVLMSFAIFFIVAIFFSLEFNRQQFWNHVAFETDASRVALRDGGCVVSMASEAVDIHSVFVFQHICFSTSCVGPLLAYLHPLCSALWAPVFSSRCDFLRYIFASFLLCRCCWFMLLLSHT